LFRVSFTPVKKVFASKGFAVLVVGAILLLFAFITTPFTITGADYLGQAILPYNLSFQNTTVGGLSGITYDPSEKVYYAVSGDRSERSPARFYTLKIDLSESFKNGDVTPIGVTSLLNEQGKLFARGSIDAEAIAWTQRGSVFIASEGDASLEIPPAIQEFAVESGQELRILPIPNKFLPGQNRGTRNNLAFESMTVTPNQRYLFTATENALIQDGPAASSNISTPCRILQYNLLTNQPEKEFLYQTEPVKSFGDFTQRFTTGLSDLLAIDNQGHFLSLERSFTGLGFRIAIFEVSLADADDIANIDTLSLSNLSNIKAVHKKLVLELKTLEMRPDNIEGLTFGSVLPDGQQSLILIADNNFLRLQRTQILAFRLIRQRRIFSLLRQFIPFPLD